MTSPWPFDILGMGTVAVDDFLHVNRFPLADEKEPVLRESRRFGGLIGSALATATRLGARCTYAGVLGTDDRSTAMRQAMEAIGIDGGRIVSRPGAGPIHSVIVVDERRHTRNIFYNLSDIKPFPLDQINEALITLAKVVLIDQLGTAEMIHAARVARQCRIPVVADMEWMDCEGKEELMANVDHLILPLQFAQSYAGTNQAETAVKKIHDRRRACTAVTAGTDGCYYLTGPDNRIYHQPAFKVTPVETTGCGDVFHGAYASALSGEVTVPQCLVIASAAAALYAGRPSGWEHLPTRTDVDGLIQ
jgi:sulfofructose kinase